MRYLSAACLGVLVSVCVVLTAWQERELSAEVGNPRASAPRGRVVKAGESEAETQPASPKTYRVTIGDKVLQVPVPTPGRCFIKIGGKVLSAETHAIAVRAEATPQERHAAEDLCRHLELLTGLEIPILEDGDVGDRNLIIVGRSRLIEKLKVRVPWDALGANGIFIRTAGANLVLAGNKRGVLYACYTFLEDYLGVRWLTPACTVFPKKGTLDVPRIDRTYVPALDYRDPYSAIARDANWSVRNKCNGWRNNLDEARGGGFRYARHGWCHTYYRLVPPEKYFKDHPEYFAEVGGYRRSSESQLCLSNPEIVEIAAETVKEWLRAEPGVRIVSVSQNDNDAYCSCEKCRAIDEVEGSPSGRLLRFVNQVAERVEKEFPDVLISTLAYHYTRKPPKITKPRRNVVVRLCSVEYSFAQPLASEQNETFQPYLKDWAKISSNLHIWDYVVNFRHFIQPHPNLRVLKPNIQLFVANNVKSVFEQGSGRIQGTELQELRTWLLAKLLWNPEADAEELIKVFLDGYYGQAAPYIGKYIDVIHDSAEKSEVFLGIGHSPINSPFLTPKVLAESERLFDIAEQSVRHDKELLNRVQTARLPILYVRITQKNACSYKESGEKLVSVWKGDLETIGRFEEIARSAGVTHLSESGDLATLEPWLATLGRRSRGLSLVPLENPKVKLSVVPALGGRIWRMRYLPAGRDNIFRPPSYIQQRWGFYWRAHYGGYAEMVSVRTGSGTEYPSSLPFAYASEYKVVRRDKRSVELQADLPNGIRINRRIELDAEKPVVRIRSTLTNIMKVPCTARLRVHPSLGVADTRRASVWAKSPKGEWRRLRHQGEKADQVAEFRDGDMPAGEWAVVDETDDLGVINRFRPDQIGKCWLFWSGSEGRVWMQMYSPDVKLKPGESMTVEHSYEVVPKASKLFVAR